MRAERFAQLKIFGAVALEFSRLTKRRTFSEATPDRSPCRLIRNAGIERLTTGHTYRSLVLKYQSQDVHNRIHSRGQIPVARHNHTRQQEGRRKPED